MTLACVTLLVVLCAVVDVFDAAPMMKRSPFHDRELGEKRGGIPNRFRGNSFHHSIFSGVQRRGIPPTAYRRAEVKDDEGATRGDDVIGKRDYLTTVLGMGNSWNRPQQSHYHFGHHTHQYGSPQYYDEDDRYDSWSPHDDYDDDDYWYYEYYDDHDDDDDDDQYYYQQQQHTDDYSDEETTELPTESMTSEPEEADQAQNQSDDTSGDVTISHGPKRNYRGASARKNSAEEPPTAGKRLTSRDYLGLFSPGQSSQQHQSYNHQHYNDQYDYYNNKHDDDDDYFDDYYDEYQYYEDDDYDKRRKREETGRQKIRTAGVDRKPPTSMEETVENQLESLKDYKRKTPTLEEHNRFVEAMKRYLHGSVLDDDFREN